MTKSSRRELRFVLGALFAALLSASGCGLTESSKPSELDDDGTGGAAEGDDGTGGAAEGGAAEGGAAEGDPEEIEGNPVVFRPSIELYDVEYANGQFIAVGLSGTYDATDLSGLPLGARSLVLRSTNGTHWKRVYQAPDGPILDIAFGHDRWVSVGGKIWWTEGLAILNSLVLTSDEGEIWTNGMPLTQFKKVIPSERGFLAISGNFVWASQTGVNWDSQGTYFQELTGLVQSNGITLAHSFGELFRSLDDGRTWEKVPPFGLSEGLPDSLHAFWATPDGFAGSTQFPAREHLDVTSSDGLSWTRVMREGDDRKNAVLQVVSENGLTLRRTEQFESQVDRRIEDGSWIPALDETIHALAFGDGVFVAVGPGGAYLSSDGETWEVGEISD